MLTVVKTGTGGEVILSTEEVIRWWRVGRMEVMKW